MKPAAYLGQQLMAELSDADPNLLNDVAWVEEAMLKAATNAGATVVNSTFHHFSPYGVSGVVVIQESHLAIHTWPEFGYAAVDLFTCGETVNPQQILQNLSEAFNAQKVSANLTFRGLREQLSTKTNYQPHSQTWDGNRRRNSWFTEKTDSLALSVRHNGELLLQNNEGEQRIEIYQSDAFGKMLVLDGHIVLTEYDESTYHEIMVHLPYYAGIPPKNVLVLGGGDGGMARELLKHPSIEQIDIIEKDPIVSSICREHLPFLANALNHPKVRLYHGAFPNFLPPEKAYDLIITDIFDPLSIEQAFFTDKFLTAAKALCTANGRLVLPLGTPQPALQKLCARYQSLKQIGEPHLFASHVPSYLLGNWYQVLLGKVSVNLSEEKRYQIAKLESGGAFNYFNSHIFEASFALPTYLKKALSI